MSDTLIDFYAKPAVSILFEPTFGQNIIDEFTNVREMNCHVDLQRREIHKKFSKLMFSVYKKMMISFQTLCLALQIAETSQFMRLLHGQSQSYNDTKKNGLSSSNTSTSSSENDLSHQNNANFQILETYAIGLLYVCHKITDDFKHKYAANVWVENLKLQTITISHIKTVQNKIVTALQFDILRPTIFTLISVLMEEMSIKKCQFSYFTNYILELYIQSSISKFIGPSNRIKRVTLTLSSLKLACHFLCPNLWDQDILLKMNICKDEVEKYSRVLFGLFLDKSRNEFIHEKYRMKRYKQVSNLKIKNESKDYQNISKKSSTGQFCQHDQNKERLKLQSKSNKFLDYQRVYQTTNI